MLPYLIDLPHPLTGHLRLDDHEENADQSEDEGPERINDWGLERETVTVRYRGLKFPSSQLFLGMIRESNHLKCTGSMSFPHEGCQAELFIEICS